MNPNCDEYRPMISACLDGELPADQRQRLEAHLAACETCRCERAELAELKEQLTMIKFREPADAELERYWAGVYNRLERTAGWAMLSLGAIVLGCYGGYKLIEDVVWNAAVPLPLRIGLPALIFGVIVLLVSLLRERLTVRKKDRYSREIER